MMTARQRAEMVELKNEMLNLKEKLIMRMRLARMWSPCARRPHHTYHLPQKSKNIGKPTSLIARGALIASSDGPSARSAGPMPDENTQYPGLVLITFSYPQKECISDQD
jgi:hypothetical protein